MTGVVEWKREELFPLQKHEIGREEAVCLSRSWQDESDELKERESPIQVG